MKNKKSHIFSLKWIVNRIKAGFAVIDEDRVTVYAAQASFFIVIAAIPFIMLLFSVSRYIIPERFYDIMIAFGNNIPGGIRELYMSIIDEMMARPEMQLISITAVITFWTVSRGMASVKDGVATVYKSPAPKSFIRGVLSSFAYTAVFIVLIIAAIAILLFGEQLNSTLLEHFEIFKSFRSVFEYRNVIFYVILALFFTLLYYSVGRRSTLPGKHFFSHVPGALVASAGWLLFSYFYSLYTIYFTDVSYIYGSLTAIVLLLFWLYCCMIIMLCGAEFNKLWAMFGRHITRKIKIRREIKKSNAQVKY
ncbi:MAG: YihY/virulence factor BrkB family protein [Clostridia bacterium]|nr:YihY/virulence factor BrkB family protein [Clostridia bacterium]